MWKILKWLFAAVVVFFVLDAAIIWGFAHVRPQIPKADAIVILGAAINTPALYNRSLEGLRLYEQGKAPVLVLSGGVDYPKSIPEALYMQQVISNNTSSVPQTVLDPDAHSTYENLKNSRRIMGRNKSVIIVSDEYHLARGVLIALRQGFYPVYWSAPKPSYYSKKDLTLYYLREMAAMVDYIPKFIFN